MLKLRTYCKTVHIVQKGNKSQVLHRLFRKVCDSEDPEFYWNAQTTESSQKTIGDRDFLEWNKTHSKRTQWLLALQLSTSISNGSAPYRFTTHFCISEFARLIVLLSTDERLRNSLLSSGEGLTRQDLNRRISKDAFWSAVVAPVYNSESHLVDFDFPIELLDVNASINPPQFRDGAELKNST